MLTRFLTWLALTKTERSVLAFLTATFLIGSGIRYGRTVWSNEPSFDYRASDSIFAARSAARVDSTMTDPPTPSKHLVDLNHATKEELDALPGIGGVTAERIIQRRQRVGAFRSVDELTSVKGISRSKLQKLRSLVTAGMKPEGVQSP